MSFMRENKSLDFSCVHQIHCNWTAPVDCLESMPGILKIILYSLHDQKHTHTQKPKQSASTLTNSKKKKNLTATATFKTVDLALFHETQQSESSSLPLCLNILDHTGALSHSLHLPKLVQLICLWTCMIICKPITRKARSLPWTSRRNQVHPMIER